MEQPPRKRSIEEIKRELAEQRQILAEALVAEAALKRDMNIEENIPPQIPTETRDGSMGDIDSIPARPISTTNEAAPNISDKSTKEKKSSKTLKESLEISKDEKDIAKEIQNFVELCGTMPYLFEELGNPQKLKVVRDMKKRIVDLVKSDAQTQYSEDLKKRTQSSIGGTVGKLAKIWAKTKLIGISIKNEAKKETELKNLEKKCFEEIFEKEKDLIKNDLYILTNKVASMDIDLVDGEPTVVYIRPPQNTPEEEAVYKDFNAKARVYADMPYEWGQEKRKLKGGNRKKYEEAQAQYNAARLALLRIRHERDMRDIREGKIDEEMQGRAILEMLQVDNIIQMEQLLNTHPEYEKILRNFSESAGKGEIIKTTGKFGNTLSGKNWTYRSITGFSAAAKTIAKLTPHFIKLTETQATALTFGTTVLAGGLVGGAKGYFRGKQSLEERKKGARYGKKDESKEKELIVDSRHLTKQLTKILNVIYSSDIPEVKQIELLKIRIEYTRGKIEKGEVNFGDAKSSLSNQFDLINILNKSIWCSALRSVHDHTAEKHIATLLKIVQKNLSEKISSAQKEFLKKQIYQGAAIGAGFATLGYGVRWFGEQMGWWGHAGTGKGHTYEEKASSTLEGNLNKNTPFAFRSIIEKYHVDPNGSLADAIKKAGGVDNIINELIRGEGSKIPSNPGNIMIPESGLLPGQRHSGVWILQKDRSGKTFYTELALYESPEAGRQAMRDIIEGAAKGNGTYGQNPTFAHFIAKYTGTNENNFGKGIVGEAGKEEGLVSRTKKWIESFTESKQNPPKEIIKFGYTDYVKEIENGQEVLVGKTYSADGKTLLSVVKIYHDGLRQDFKVSKDGIWEKHGQDGYITDETYFEERGFKITLPAEENEAPATPPTAKIPEKEKTEVPRENERVEKITEEAEKTESKTREDLINKEVPQKPINEIPAGTWIPARPGDEPTAGTWIPDEPTPKAPAAHVSITEEREVPEPVTSTKSAEEVVENLTSGEVGNIKKWGFVMEGEDWVRNFKRNGINYIEKISKAGYRDIYRVDGNNKILIRTRKLFPSEAEDFNIKTVPEKPGEMLQKEPLRDDAKLENGIHDVEENKNKVDVGSVDDQPTIDEEKIISEGKRILKDGTEEIVINGKLRIRIYPNGDREEYIYNPETGKLHQFISRDEGLYNFSGNGELNYIKLPNGIEEFYTSGNLGPYLSKVLDSNGNDIDIDKHAQTAQRSPLPEINPAITPMDKVLEQTRIEQEETSTPETKPQRTISDIKEDIKNKIDSAETPQNIPSGVGREVGVGKTMEIGREYQTYGTKKTPIEEGVPGKMQFHYTPPDAPSPYTSYGNRDIYEGQPYGSVRGETFFPDLSPEENTLLNTHPEFVGQNPFHFTGKQLLEIYKTHDHNLRRILNKDVGVWSTIKSQPAYSIMKIKEDEASIAFKPLVSYLELLKKATGLKPETRTIFHRAETLEEYLGRALQKAAQKKLLEKLKI